MGQGSTGPGTPCTPPTAKDPPGNYPGKDRRCCAGRCYEAGKTHARSSAPGHGYYTQVKDSKNSKRAALPEACKIVRQACHILTGLGAFCVPKLTSAKVPRAHISNAGAD